MAKRRGGRRAGQGESATPLRPSPALASADIGGATRTAAGPPAPQTSVAQDATPLQQAIGWGLRRFQRLDTGWRLGLSLLMAQRVVLGAIALVAVFNAPKLMVPGEPWPHLVLRGGEPWSLPFTSWNHWDAVRYYDLAQNGYVSGRQTGGLYPLFPLVARTIAFALGDALLPAELLVSSVAFVISMWLLYQIVLLEGGGIASVAVWRSGRRVGVADPVRTQRLAVATVLLVALFPTGFFLFAPYTESLFLALTLASFWYMRRGHWWLAGIAGFLAALTRFPGAFLALPLAYEYVRQRDVLSWLRRQGGHPPGLSLLATGLPVLGMLGVIGAVPLLRSGQGGSYVLSVARFLGQRVNGERPASDMLGAFGFQVVPPWEALWASLQYVLRWTEQPPGSLPGIELINLVASVSFVVLGVLALRQLPLVYSLYVWPSLVLLLTHQLGFSPLMSNSRYLLVIFPCFIVLALLLVDRRRVLGGWLAGSAILQCALMWYYASAGFVA